MVTSTALELRTDMDLLMEYFKGEVEFPMNFPDEPGADADGAAFVKELLTVMPPDRPSARKALESPWLMDLPID